MSTYVDATVTPGSLENLQWGLKRFEVGRRRELYKLFCQYYDGQQPMAFATDKFKAAFFQVFKDYSENFCPGIVDALNDRLEVVGFRSNKATMKQESMPSLIPSMGSRKRVSISDPVGQQAWDVWSRNRMDLQSSEVHLESLKAGDAYVVVWPNEQGEATIWPQNAHGFDVQYDPNNKGKLLRAVKLWLDEVEGYWRINIYTASSIEKYRSRKTNNLQIQTKPADYLHMATIENPYQRVPAFHFPNQTEYRYGISELKDVIPVQDALNKSVIDMLVAMEFASYKQRYIIGMDVETDPDTGEPLDANAKNYGADRMMTIPDPEAKVGQFDATDLGQFLRVQEKFWSAASRISGTPLHYFFITQGDFPSGEAQKAAEARFVKRIKDRQTAFGNQWEDVIKFCAQIDGFDQADLEFSAMWTDSSPRSDAEIADTAVKKKAIGVPRTQLMREMGYTDEEIEMFIEESDAETLARAQMAQTPQENAGNGSQGAGSTGPPNSSGGGQTEQGRARQGVRQ